MASRGGGQAPSSRFVTVLVSSVVVVAVLSLVLALRSPQGPSAPPDLPPSEGVPPRGGTGAAAGGDGTREAPVESDSNADSPMESDSNVDSALESDSHRDSKREPERPGAGASEREVLPRVAIVLDDCGERGDIMERAVRSKLPLTFAVLPHLRDSSRCADLAHAAGHEVIVHQPMEPESRDENPGDRAIRSGMKEDRIGKILAASFKDVPHAIGLNNHMGSAATADRELMEAFVAALERVRPGAVFLDSRTTPKTVAAEVARRHGLATAERAVFLDNDLAPAAIRGELTRLIRLAAERGEAVAIGHLKPETLDVLEQEIPRLEARECKFVFLSALVR